jgi:hypothetical protein
MPGINTPFIPNQPQFTPAPQPAITIVLPSPELEELKKKVEELEKRLLKLCPPEEHLSGEGPVLDPSRVVEV